MRALVAGANGFVGRRLVPALIEDGLEVRCVVRTTEGADQLSGFGCELFGVDLVEPTGLERAMRGVDVAYFLIHMMGREEDYPREERQAARIFACSASGAGAGQLVYLGGLGEHAGSAHLQSRHATAEALREHGPPLTYFRAGMIVGPGSESYVLLRSIVERLPAIPSPRWLETRTQPIGVRDVVEYLRQAPHVPAALDREIQIGGPDVVTAFELIERMATELGVDPPRRLRLPGATPDAVAAGAGATTTGSEQIAIELTKGLAGETVVTDPSGAALFDIDPEPLSVALQRALEEEERQGATPAET